MSTKVENKEGLTITVVDSAEEEKFLTPSDIEMDKRAVEAVKAAIRKAEVCKKPIAKYDLATKRAYIEYPNGEKEYVI